MNRATLITIGVALIAYAVGSLVSPALGIVAAGLIFVGLGSLT